MTSLLRGLPAGVVGVLFFCAAAPAQSPTQWRQMDFGPFFSGTFRTPIGPAGNPTFKGVAVKLRPDGKATALFDTDLLRMSAWWSGGFIELAEGRDGLGDGVSAHPAGTVKLITTNGPGWSAKENFNDPRSQPWGPLPATWAKYRGLYLNGNHVVFNYSVGDVAVLDSPGVESDGDFEVFSRTLNFRAAASSLNMIVCERSGAHLATNSSAHLLVWEHDNQATAVAVIPSSSNATLKPADGGRTHLAVGASNSSERVKLLLWNGTKSDLARFMALAQSSGPPVDLQPLTLAGARHWDRPVITAGVLGAEPGAYVADTITAPYDNPWKSYLRFSGHDFFGNGDAAICSISGDVWIVKGLDAGLKKISWIRYATGLFEPLGLKIVNETVYVLGRDQITRLRDLNGDGEADAYENFNNDSHVFGHGHGFHTELHTDAAGNFYYAICADPDNRPGEHGGTIVKVSKDGRRLERIATGFRNPNGMTVGRDGRVTIADQQGNWVPAGRLDVVHPEGFYGYMPMHHRTQAPTTYDAPMLWFPQEVDNSCGGQAWIESDRWGPVKGRLAHLSYGACRLFIVMPEMVDGQAQAATVQVPVRFNAGVMRARFNPRDGQLYVCGLRGWQTSGTLSGGFYRVRFTGKPLHLPTDFKVKTGGVHITFSEPLDRSTAEDRESYSVVQWNYLWSKEYGSAHYSVAEPGKKNEDKVEVKSVQLASDGRSVFLEIPGLRPVMQMRIKYNLTAADGTQMKSEIHNTINAVAKN